MPARIKPSRTLSLELAGPMVQTIFVRRISTNVHESVEESTKTGGMEYWNARVMRSDQRSNTPSLE
jgi:hypothetical protein